MKKFLLTAFFSLAVSPMLMLGKCQTVTSSVPEGRYEVIVGSSDSEQKYKLDKCTGKVWQLWPLQLSAKPYWKEVDREGSDSEVEYKSGTNFQLVIGGNKPTDCFLIDVNNGRTWQMRRNENRTHYLQKVE